MRECIFASVCRVPEIDHVREGDGVSRSQHYHGLPLPLIFLHIQQSREVWRRVHAPSRTERIPSFIDQIAQFQNILLGKVVSTPIHIMSNRVTAIVDRIAQLKNFFYRENSASISHNMSDGHSSIKGRVSQLNQLIE